MKMGLVGIANNTNPISNELREENMKRSHTRFLDVLVVGMPVCTAAGCSHTSPHQSRGGHPECGCRPVPSLKPTLAASKDGRISRYDNGLPDSGPTLFPE